MPGVKNEAFKDYYQTPDYRWKPILDFIGKPAFDLDPCAPIHPVAGINVPALRRFTEQENGLTQLWGRYNHILLNPPYSDLPTWTAKALIEAQYNYIWAIYPLRNNQFYQDVINQTALFRVAFRARTSFLDPETKEPCSGNREGTYLVHWGPDEKYKQLLETDPSLLKVEGELILNRPIQLRTA